MPQQTQTYECTNLDAMGDCDTWQVVAQNESMPTLDQSEQNQLLLSVLSVMVIVWLFKMLKRAI